MSTPQLQSAEADPDAIYLVYRGGKSWQIAKSFTVTVDDTAYQVREHDVSRPATDGNGTDLASVPTLLWGVVGPYGPHMKAALLHDQLCVDARKEPTKEWQLRRQADSLFRRALNAAGYGTFRRWLMWAGVRLGAQFSVPIRGAVVVVIAVVGMIALSRIWVWALCNAVAFVPRLFGASESSCAAPGSAVFVLALASLGTALLLWRWAQGSVAIGILVSPFFIPFVLGYVGLWLVFHVVDWLARIRTKGFKKRESELRQLAHAEAAPPR